MLVMDPLEVKGDELGKPYCWHGGCNAGGSPHGSAPKLECRALQK